jgi:hypothetical protein
LKQSATTPVLYRKKKKNTFIPLFYIVVNKTINLFLPSNWIFIIYRFYFKFEITGNFFLNILDFNKLRGERENEDREQQLPDSNGAAEKNTES